MAIACKDIKLGMGLVALARDIFLEELLQVVYSLQASQKLALIDTGASNHIPEDFMLITKLYKTPGLKLWGISLVCLIA